MEKALRTALLAVKLGAELGYDQPVLSDTYYLALLWHVGCTADAYDFATWVGGDDIAFRSVSAALPSASVPETLRHMVDYVGKGRPFPQRLGLVTAMLVGGQPRFRKVVANCDAAVILARRLGLRPEVCVGLGQLFERWDGKGEPAGLGGDQLSPAFRVVQVAHDVEIFERLRDRDAATAVVQQRRGGAYDPAVCDAFIARARAQLAEVPTSSVWNDALEAEPMPQLGIPESRLDELALAFAEFANLKSPLMLGHSAGVARIAETAADALGWPQNERTAVRRAALLHDLGRTGVPNGIWDKPGRLSPARVRASQAAPLLHRAHLAAFERPGTPDLFRRRPP
jgi:hypothetical protein